MSMLDGFLSLMRGRNLATEGEKDETREGVAGPKLDELTLEKEDKELVALATSWEDAWNRSEAKKDLERKQKENEKYWLADHSSKAEKVSGKRALTDNLVFEALETFLPAATRQNPEPLVTSDHTQEGQTLAKKVTDRLRDLNDTLRFKLKLKKAARHWSLYYLGCIQLGWSMARNEITMIVRRPQTLILDPDAITDECEYEGERLGIIRSDVASDLISRFPAKEEYIKDKVNGKLGTKLQYTEWWTNDYLFWKLDGEILGKSKNPHWNYDETQEIPEQQTVGDNGEAIVIPASQNVIKGLNHFASRKIPFAFLSVFNLGINPFDDTNPIEQVLSLQDVINKRQRQIDKNADNQNGGAVVSGSAFTKEQARQVTEALRKGATVWVPKGNVNEVYKRDQGAALPEAVYRTLNDYRQELRNIFGTAGLSASGIKSEETVRGKIMVRGADSDRASIIVDHLEQFADYICNWEVQLMMVYYDTPRNVSRTQGSTTIVNTEFTHPLVVSIKEGSMIPKDALTKRNEAVDLWTSKGIDPITFYKALDFPNPYESAKSLYLWQTNPIALFPDLLAKQQADAAALLAKTTVPADQGGGAPVAEIQTAEPKVEPGGDPLAEVPIT